MPTSSRALWWGAYLVALHLIVVFGYVPFFVMQARRPSISHGADFNAYRTAAAIVVGPRRHELYDVGVQQAAQRGLLGPAYRDSSFLPFLNPPHMALALAPLAFVERAVGLWLWSAAQLAALAWLALRLADLAVGGGQRRGSVLWWAAATAVWAFRPAFESLQLGQCSVFVAAGALMLLRALRTGSAGAAAAGVLLLSLKPQLLPLPLAALAATGSWRPLAIGGAVVGVATLVTAAVLGPGVWTSYVSAVSALESHFGGVGPEHMQSVRGVLMRAFGLSGELSREIAMGLMAAGAVTLYAWARWRSRRVAPDVALAMGIAGGLLTAPHLFMQDVLVAAIPATVLFAAAKATPWARIFASSWAPASLLDHVLESSEVRLPVRPMALWLMVALVWLSRLPGPAEPRRGP